ncbi:hypothetical protein [Thalassiella azotivora]
MSTSPDRGSEQPTGAEDTGTGDAASPTSEHGGTGPAGVDQQLGAGVDPTEPDTAPHAGSDDVGLQDVSTDDSAATADDPAPATDADHPGADAVADQDPVQDREQVAEATRRAAEASGRRPG